MNSIRHVFLLLIGFTCLASVAPTTLQAQLRKVTLDLVVEDSIVQIDGSVKIGEFEEVPLNPQKNGITPGQETDTGLASHVAKWSGTIEGIVDMSNNTFQITGGIQIPEYSGDYCPPAFPSYSPDHDDNECPNEEPGVYAYTLGDSLTEGLLSTTSRDAYFALRGQAPFNDATDEIDVLNWHAYFVTLRVDFDGRGGLEEIAGAGVLPIDQRWNSTDDTDSFHDYGDTAVDTSDYHNVAEATLINAGHFENDPEADDFNPGQTLVNEATDFKGIFAITGEDVTLDIPIWVPALLATDLTTRTPSDFIRLVVGGHDLDGIGRLKATGTLGDTITLPEDVNEDGVVDGLDVNIVSKNWEKGSGHAAAHTPDFREDHVRDHPDWLTYFQGDVNLNGNVDQTDLDLIAAAFGLTAGGGSAQPVPEPGSLLLAFLAAVACLAFSRPKTSR